MLPKPRKGLYFPLSPRRTADLTRAWRLNYSKYFERTFEAPIRFANPSGRATELALAQLWGKHAVTVYSVPETIAPEVASIAAERALDVCGELSRAWKQARGWTHRSYLIRFEVPDTLILLEATIRYQLRKYPGPRQSRAVLKELRRISLA